MQWYSGSIAEAVSAAKRNNKLFLVYVEGSDGMSQTMSTTYNDTSVTEKLTSEDIIALKLVENSVPYMQFCQIYPVLVIPSSFFIGGNGAPIEIISGCLTPAEFCSKIEKVFEMYNQTKPSQKPAENSGASTSAQNMVTPSAAASSSSSSNDLSQPSTSTAASNSEDSNKALEDKVERAKVLIEAQRQSKAAEEIEKEKKDEIARRNMGKAVQHAQLTKKETEMKEWAKSRAKDKEEERLAREKVKAMIAQDRAEQAVRYERFKASEEAERKKIQQKQEEEERARRDAEAAINSNEARLQFRLPDGSYSTHSFSADDILEDARRYVKEEVRPPFSHFSLCTTFPRRHFSESDYPETLRNLQLAPSAVLLILPEQAVSSINQSANFVSSMFWFLMSPFTSIWNYVRSFFVPAPTPPPQTQPNQSVPSTSEASDNNDKMKPQSDNRQSAIRRRESPFAKREGNVFRINNQSDDDENNTWNGNSTQQM